MVAEYIPCPFPYFPIPYGCWCGITIPFPPLHEEPVDVFDAQCKSHDYCYEEVNAEQGCNLLDNYFWSYEWHLIKGEVLILELLQIVYFLRYYAKFSDCLLQKQCSVPKGHL